MFKIYFRLTILLLCLLFTVQSAAAEDIIVKGRVTHAQTGQPLANVNIFVDGSAIGSSSQPNGMFSITIPSGNAAGFLIFEHVGFDTLIVEVQQLTGTTEIQMIPGFLQTREIEVEESRVTSVVARDLPQPLTVIGKEIFQERGYMDIADVLVNRQSIRIEETANGKKTITMRAGNADDVLVLMGGVKLNSIYDNVFDLSLINLDDVERIEIIKGSHTALYGSDAFSGIVNIVPRFYKPYSVKFQQRFGTYNAADWTVQFNYNVMQKINLSYSYKKGNSFRNYVNDPPGQKTIENKQDNHSASLVFNLTGNDTARAAELCASFHKSTRTYQNHLWNEFLSGQDDVFSLKYSGGLYGLEQLVISGAYQQLQNDQGLNTASSFYNRQISGRRFNFHFEKTLNYKIVDLLLAYQPEISKMDVQNKRVVSGETEGGVRAANYGQSKNGLVSILKIHAPTSDKFINTFDVDVSYRFDRVDNKINQLDIAGDEDTTTDQGEQTWQESTIKFSTFLAGKNKPYEFSAFLNFGSNVKFPSLQQQLSTPGTMTRQGAVTQPSLQPERNFALEINGKLTKKIKSSIAIEAWQLALNFFKNDYENKFRMYRVPYNPVVFYDNVQTATISGWDLNGKLFLNDNRFTIEGGLSKYNVSARAAFPFKYEMKNIINIQYENAGYSFAANFYREGEQTGVIRTVEGRFEEIILPAYANIDLHLNKKFSIRRLRFFANLSGRNLLDSDARIEGVAIRDRRFYMTFGAQF